jgi:hypothetical protein
MKQIADFFSRDLHNNEHGQFNANVLNEINQNPFVRQLIDRFYQAYVSAVDAEATAETVENGSVITKFVNNSNAYRAQLFHGYSLVIEGLCIGYDPLVAEAARDIQRIIDQTGDIRSMAYNDRGDAIKNFTTQLRTNHMDQVVKTTGIVWLDKMDEANFSFNSHLDNRATEEISRLSGDVRAARLVTDKAYKDITNQINALALVNGDTEYAPFIDKINYWVEHNKTLLKTRRTRRRSGSNDTSAPTT